jgi:AraC family transcriptional activator of mtrCDE
MLKRITRRIMARVTAVPQADWLSSLLNMVTVTGQLDYRCAYGAPWRVEYEPSASEVIPYHVILKGHAVLEDETGKALREVRAGDVVLLPHGAAHVLHDGSGRKPARSREHAVAGWQFSENAGRGERLEMMCGRFFVAPPHGRFLRGYLPSDMVVRTAGGDVHANASGGGEPAAPGAAPIAAGSDTPATEQLAHLLALMRTESSSGRLGGAAMLNALSAVLFTLVLRGASETGAPPKGLLAVAGNPRLLPALTAMFDDPARAWTLPELARRCSMSRATFMRHFQEHLGRSAADLLTHIRMTMAANELKKPAATAEAVADTVGYQSVAAFRRAFTRSMGMTPGEWRRGVRLPAM